MDLNDGYLKEQYKCYQDRIQKIVHLKLVNCEELQPQLNPQLKKDLEFLNKDSR